MAELSISGLVKRYGDFHAVRDVSLDIADGEFLVLLGPSGCGKTTTLRCVAGLEHPTEGEISLGGEPISAPARGILMPPRLRLPGWLPPLPAPLPFSRVDGPSLARALPLALQPEQCLAHSSRSPA